MAGPQPTLTTIYLMVLQTYTGMFSGNRIGGMPTVQLEIIANELSMLERGSRPMPVGLSS